MVDVKSSLAQDLAQRQWSLSDSAAEKLAAVVRDIQERELLLPENFLPPLANVILEYLVIEVEIRRLMNECEIKLDSVAIGCSCPPMIVKDLRGALSFVLKIPLWRIVVIQSESGELMDGDFTWRPLRGSKGRPFTTSSSGKLLPEALTANSTKKTDTASDWIIKQRNCVQSTLPSQIRSILTEHWTTSALAEHASIASFSRFILQLMAIGAPCGLIAQAQQASLDEIRHARLCFTLASIYAGTSIGPTAFPLEETLIIETNLGDVASGTIREGCIEETISCFEACVQRELAKDENVMGCLTTIVDDEIRHAALAWKTVQWVMSKDNKLASEAIKKSLTILKKDTELKKKIEEQSEESDLLLSHGQLPESMRTSIRAFVLAKVVVPWLSALQSTTTPTLPKEGDFLSISEMTSVKSQTLKIVIETLFTLVFDSRS